MLPTKEQIESGEYQESNRKWTSMSKKEFEQYLVDTYPILYQDMWGKPTETCMAWGCTVDRGWRGLIVELSELLKAHKVKAAQIKEKFGWMRFYIDGLEEGAFEPAQTIIHQAESLTVYICERCGAFGKLTTSGWRKVYCNACLV